MTEREREALDPDLEDERPAPQPAETTGSVHSVEDDDLDDDDIDLDDEIYDDLDEDEPF